MNKKLNILICPLDWGLGHATRCIPIIKQLLIKNTNVLIAGSGASLELLKSEFPDLEFIQFDGYNIKYPRNGRMVLKMFIKLPSILYLIFIEHRKLSKIIKRYDIDAVISDNRYGLFSKRIPSVFITHQLLVKCPIWLKFFEPLLYLINNFFLSKYLECWVPDYSGKINLSGDLSHKYPRLHHVFFIGPQSRFYNRNYDLLPKCNIYDLMVILSGPEPQRSILENVVINQLADKDIKAIVVLGKPENIDNYSKYGNVNIYDCLTSDKILAFMDQSNLILCRSGYSSIMDICALGKKAILIPTPGQTEQEYLAQFFMEKKIFYSQIQHRLDICEAIKESEGYSGIRIKENTSLLNKRLDELLEKIKKNKKKQKV